MQRCAQQNPSRPWGQVERVRRKEFMAYCRSPIFLFFIDFFFGSCPVTDSPLPSVYPADKFMRASLRLIEFKYAITHAFVSCSLCAVLPVT